MLLLEAMPPTRTQADGTARLRVLVVDDHRDTAQSMAAVLRCYGYEARVALDGPTALKDAAAVPPDVVLLDIGLPGMDGYEVARRLQEQSRIKRPLLIAITGYGRPEDRQRSSEAGIDLHLVKPANLDYLETVLKRFEQFLIPELGL